MEVLQLIGPELEFENPISVPKFIPVTIRKVIGLHAYGPSLLYLRIVFQNLKTRLLGCRQVTNAYRVVG